MPQHFLNERRSLPMINTWLPVICQVTKCKMYMLLKVEGFQPTSFSLLSVIYHETPGKMHLKMLARVYGLLSRLSVQPLISAQVVFSAS